MGEIEPDVVEIEGLAGIGDHERVFVGGEHFGKKESLLVNRTHDRVGRPILREVRPVDGVLRLHRVRPYQRERPDDSHLDSYSCE